MLLTRTELLNAAAGDRATLVQDFALEVVTNLRPAGAAPLNGGSRLADAGVDSLQVVELKFSLDELMGRESEVELFISNPSVRQLAEDLLRAAGL